MSRSGTVVAVVTALQQREEDDVFLHREALEENVVLGTHACREGPNDSEDEQGMHTHKRLCTERSTDGLHVFCDAVAVDARRVVRIVATMSETQDD